MLRQLDDKRIKNEAESRDIDFSAGRLDEAFADGVEEGYADGQESAITAIAQIRAGKPDEAIITLERAFLPAWEDTAACEARYREVMGMAA